MGNEVGNETGNEVGNETTGNETTGNETSNETGNETGNEVGNETLVDSSIFMPRKVHGNGVKKQCLKQKLCNTLALTQPSSTPPPERP